MDMSWNEAKDWCQSQGRQLACWIGLNCIDNETGHWISSIEIDNQFAKEFCVEMSSVLDGVWTGKSCSDQSHLHLPLCEHQGIWAILWYLFSCKMQK